MTLHWRAPAGLHTASVQLPVEGELASFDGATGWLNSAPLTPAGLRGKAVLVNFWTYTCINWLRQLPYVRAWAGKYSGQGLVVIGVHTPEFGFEHNPDNVRRATADMRVDYPVATDNDYAVWRAFDNYYWPALYFADAQGRIRPRPAVAGSPFPTARTRLRRSCDAGCAPPRRRSRGQASSNCRRRAIPRSRCRSRPGNRLACPARPGGRCRGRARTETRVCARRSPPGPGRSTYRPRRGHREAGAAS